ncbi:DUF4268 domain-containing protein [Leptolyngbya sp. FACHB-711]|uniref:DUF4268 domain-containing protein n=1 Tax=unclassified Leptolyngbya TaxID=2650499 RepID=UPI0016844573|nr:DUF4268 domain-containing protein [Leptolyngbya sp. FACHB-711]MBD1850004.1 DUF4268 domain-containing protein [Cyanobacteria bacterium FACHB-502]MBD2027499.1 DUF4268 domain-containing protein [Leptolyngbya sp. FACHB-711]
MPFIVQHLIPESQSVVTATEDMSVQAALGRMLENKFSQLPVVDQGGKLRGMITHESILQAISYFGVTPDKLKVSHALFKVKPCSHEDELSELLNGLRDNSAIPIVDNNNCLTGIITSYDTTEYFRQRAEDIMLAEDIEITLRDLIEGAYKDGKGEIDASKLNEAIKAITPSEQEFLGRFSKAVKYYVQKYTSSKQFTEQGSQMQPSNHSIQFNQKLVNEAFNQHLSKPIQPKPFEQLALSEYIQLLKNAWAKYESSFNSIEWEALDRLLNEIRQIRNSIAHFREVTTNQRQQLRYCANLLNYHRPSIRYSEAPVTEAVTVIANLYLPIPTATLELNTIVQNSREVEKDQRDLLPFDEEISPNDSRYALLAVWLQSQADLDSNRVQLTFRQIEDIIKGDLPPSARQHRNWWANDSVSHVQSQQWLEVGWRVADVNMSEERVVFARMGDRQNAYVSFFNDLQLKLNSIDSLTIQPAMNLQGRSWSSIEVTSAELPKPSYINFSFARRSRFRIEHYIDTGEQYRNKQIFDALYNYKEEIETKLGERLSWERLDSRRACRVALYRDEASIADPPEQLAKLQDWTVRMTVRFYKAVIPYLQKVEQS